MTRLNRTRVMQGNQTLDLLRKGIVDEFSTLAEGVSVAGHLCPKCFGGSKNEGSFSVTRGEGVERGELKFLCHRASCGFSGRVPLGSAGLVPHVRAGEPERKPERPSYDALGRSALPEDIGYLLRYRYGLTPRDVAWANLQWNEAKDRLILPTKDNKGDIYGYVLREMRYASNGTLRSFPKTLNYFDTNRGAWYGSQLSQPQPKLIIVEDQLSAARACSYINSVALLGTNLTEDVLNAIKEKQYAKVYIALDADAFPVAIKMVRRLRNAGIKAEVVKLPKDIKDMNEEMFVTWLDEADIEWWQTIGDDK
jgi:hypothetical protein